MMQLVRDITTAIDENKFTVGVFTYFNHNHINQLQLIKKKNLCNMEQNTKFEEQHIHGSKVTLRVDTKTYK